MSVSDCTDVVASFLADLEEEVPCEQFERYTAEVAPLLPPEVLSQLVQVERLLAEARAGVRKAELMLLASRTFAPQVVLPPPGRDH